MNATEVIPGVYRISLATPFTDSKSKFVNTYLFRGDNGCLLIDTGWNEEGVFQSLKSQLADIGVSLRDITQIAITHIHPDHYGSSGRLKEETNATLAVHHVENTLVRKRYINMEELLQETDLMLQKSGVPEDSLTRLKNASVIVADYVYSVPPDIRLRDGQIVSNGSFNFRVLLSPGHSPGHICFYEPDKKILVSGDHILPQISPHIGLHPQSGLNPLDDYISSLKEIRELDIHITLPGHGKPFTETKTRIDTIIKHHRQRSANILAELKSGPSTTYQIARKINWSSGGFDSLPDIHQRLAMLETLAHLESLKSAGLVDKYPKEGIIYYYQT